MDDVVSHSERVPRDVLRRLLVRSDGPGLVRLLAALAALAGGGALAVALAAAHSPWAHAAAALAGLGVAGCFPALHESGHGHAFRTPLLNRATAWVCSVVMLEAPTFFREFHWEHHRQTQSRARDPEISMSPDTLDDWPGNPLVYLALVSGQLLLLGKLMFTAGCALLPASLWRRIFPWVPAARVRAVAWECRLVLLVLASVAAAGLAWIPGFWAFLLAWPIGHVLLGFYLMPEHTGLPHDGTQLHRTRTILSNRPVRWWMWNMPYHGEHHAYPAVPFHALPRLHALLEPELEHVSRGYLAFHAEALLRSLVRRR